LFRYEIPDIILFLLYYWFILFIKDKYSNKSRKK
jgi:hypothetical protein